jgi:hypothetical protein
MFTGQDILCTEQVKGNGVINSDYLLECSLLHFIRLHATHIVTVFLVHWRYDMSSDQYSVIHIIIRFFCIWDLLSRCTNWKRKQLPLRVRFEVFTGVIMKNAVFWDVALCRFCVNCHFGGTYRLHLQGRKNRERGTSVSRWLQWKLASFCLHEGTMSDWLLERD